MANLKNPMIVLVLLSAYVARYCEANSAICLALNRESMESCFITQSAVIRCTKSTSCSALHVWKETKRGMTFVSMRLVKKVEVSILIFQCGDIHCNPGPYGKSEHIREGCLKPEKDRSPSKGISGFNGSGPLYRDMSPNLNNLNIIPVRITTRLYANKSTFRLKNPISVPNYNLIHIEKEPTQSNLEVRRGPKKNLNVAHLNIQSLNRNHHTQLKQLMSVEDFDILTLSETWLNSTHTNASILIPGYRLIRQDRLGKRGGGICAYVRSSIKVMQMKDLSTISSRGFQQLWLQIQQRNLRSILICVVYRPPNCPISCSEEMLVPNMTHALSLNKDFLIAGDLNCNLLSSNVNSSSLRGLCENFNLKQLITSPTRVSRHHESLIDVIISSNPTLIKDSGVKEITISDHFLAYAVLNLREKNPGSLS